MDTFPFDSHAAAVEAAGAYYTWGPASGAGPTGMSVTLAILGIAISVICAVLVTTRENSLLNHASDRLAEKYQ